MHSIGSATFNFLTMNTKTPNTFNLSHDPPVLDLCVKKKEPQTYAFSTFTYNKTLHHSNALRNMSESSEDSESSNSPSTIDDSSTNSPKAPRPFKAFPKNPLAFSLDIFGKLAPLGTPESLGRTESNYEEFRRMMLAKVQGSKGINMNMRRNQNQDQQNTDPMYLERRKKNNEAARKSRETRKAREDEIAIRCAFLEQENMRLKANLASVEMDVERLKRLLFRR